MQQLNPVSEPPLWLTVDQVAARLQCSARLVYTLVAQKQLRAAPTDRQWERVRAEEGDELRPRRRRRCSRAGPFRRG